MSVTDSTVTTPARPSANQRTGARGTTARDPVDLTERANAITERELAVYAAANPRLAAATERARKVLPAGVPSSFQAYDPHPIVVKHAVGLADDRRRRQRVRRLRHGLRCAVRRAHASRPCAVRSRPSSTTARSTSRRANSTPRSPSSSPSGTTCRCGGRPTRAPKRRWTPSASPVVSPNGRSWSRSRAATTATTTR